MSEEASTMTEEERKAIYTAIERIERLESKDAKLIPRALVDRITELERLRARVVELEARADGINVRELYAQVSGMRGILEAEGITSDRLGRIEGRIEALRACHKRSLERIEALRADGQSMHEVFGRRIEAVRAEPREDLVTIREQIEAQVRVNQGYADRIDALEAHHMTTLAERWWRTHDAALSGCEASAAVWHDENAMYEHCVACADRAHGPLEAPDTVALLDAHRLTVEHAALVKAAQELCVWCDTHLATSTSGRLTALHEALKPFEPEPKPISGAEFVDGMEEEIHKRNTEVDALVKACRELERRFNSVIRGDPEHVEFVAALKPFQVKP